MNEAASTPRTIDSRDRDTAEDQLQSFEIGQRFGTDPAEQWEVVDTRSDGVIIESPGGCTFAARQHDDGVWLHSGPDTSNRLVRIRKFATPMDAQIGVLDRLEEGDIFEVDHRPGTFKVVKVMDHAAAEVAKGSRSGWMSPTYRLTAQWGTFGIPAKMEDLNQREQYDFEISPDQLRLL